ncbi:MAG: HD domain-containing protein [Eubacteriales bacterium]
MRYLKELKDGDKVSEIYLCKHKQSAMTKNGKQYENVILQDKTGTIDAKIWDPNSMGIAEFDKLDYIDVSGDVTSFQGTLQLSIKRVRVCKEGEYEAGDYLPVSTKDIEVMYKELLGYMERTENIYLKKLLHSLFVKDEEFAKRFKQSSAAKAVHHGFVGGLLEHTLSLVKLCDFFCMQYPILQKDLLITAAICHDIGKTKELSLFPENDYTDAGQYLGHIVMGVEMVGEVIGTIDGFPESLAQQLKHCIVAHHGELEYGSPKKPALAEAIALNFADNVDAKMQTFLEAIEATEETGWIGYNRLFESNIRRTILES